MSADNRLIYINTTAQRMLCYHSDTIEHSFPVSTAKNGLGEQINSGCTPRGWHKVHAVIGEDHAINSVFVARAWTGEIYSDKLVNDFPDRDWIITRIIQLDGLEPGRNRKGDVDSLRRYIYIHGTPDTTQLGIPNSQGCIRMDSHDIIKLCSWLTITTLIYIE